MTKVFFGLLLLLAIIALTGIAFAETPDMVGTWTGSATAHHEERGIIEGPDNSIIMNISEQKGRIFYGDIQIMNKDGTYRSEKLAGIIELSGEEFIILEHDQGISLGDFIGPDEIEIIYIENAEGDEAGIIATNHLIRNKAETAETAESP